MGDDLNGAPDPDLPRVVPDAGADTMSKKLNFSFSTQNVRSLNISTKNDITTQKILAICSLNTDFIFLADIRLNSVKQISALNDIKKKFFLKGYQLFFNSPGPSRGTGILVKKTIVDTNFRILSEVSDPEGNFIILHIKINGLKLVLTSIYGPNHDEEINFFNSLEQELQNFSDPYIIGGDWNATLDFSRVNSNIDVINMQNIPSIRRSIAINQLCTSLQLIDPYRALYPNKKEYTFIPSSVHSTNRSRLDFFLISGCIFDHNTECSVPHSLTSLLFDHKPVKLYFAKKKLFRKEVVKDIILKNLDLRSQVRFAVYECYLLHVDPNQNHVEPAVIQQLLLGLGHIGVLLKEICDRELSLIESGSDLDDDLILAAKRADVNLRFEDFPPLEFFENLPSNVHPDILFQTLNSCIKNRVLSHQSFFFKKKTARRRELTNRISNLKTNFNQNTVTILEAERLLSTVIESDLKAELALYKNFECLNDEKITPSFMKIIKSNAKEEKITDICDIDGVPFDCNIRQKNFIHDYYQNIYKRINQNNITVNDINNFLGPVSNHQIVQNAKLTEIEKNCLESDITLEELTKSINNANMSSAPGADGISNRFIKHFWEF